MLRCRQRVAALRRHEAGDDAAGPLGEIIAVQQAPVAAWRSLVVAGAGASATMLKQRRTVPCEGRSVWGEGRASVTDDNHETRNESSFIFRLDFLQVLFSHRLVLFNFDDSYIYMYIYI